MLIVVPASQVNPSGFRWYMAPMMTKSDPSSLAWMMSSSLAERPTLPSPAASTWTTAGVFGPPWPSSDVTSRSAKCPFASPRYQADHSMSGTQLNCVPTVPASPPPPPLVLAWSWRSSPAVVPACEPAVVSELGVVVVSPQPQRIGRLDTIVSPRPPWLTARGTADGRNAGSSGPPGSCGLVRLCHVHRWWTACSNLPASANTTSDVPTTTRAAPKARGSSSWL